MLVALDDTDSAEGGCTTHTGLALLHAMGWTLRGMPRLVRLNPNCPHKTRGNGAVVLDIGRPEGPRVQVGSWGGEPIYAYPDSPPADVDLATAWAWLQDAAEPGSQPGLVASKEPLPNALYWQTVQTLVDPGDVHDLLDASGIAAIGGRGVVGCAGALAWQGPASSHELLMYRDPSRWGTPRTVGDLGPLHETFHSYDGPARTFVPATPCPVLLGLRALAPEPLADLVATVAGASEPVAGWAIWTTNQASGDHVRAIENLLDAPEGGTVRLPVRVTEGPLVMEGGHVHVALEDTQGVRFEAVAFEPSGALRDGVRLLQAGDRVEVTGALRGTLRLESLRILEAPRKLANPTCCGKSMKSKGARAGYRCAKCGKDAASEAATFSPLEGQWEARVSARRHLHRPLDW